MTIAKFTAHTVEHFDCMGAMVARVNTYWDSSAPMADCEVLVGQMAHDYYHMYSTYIHGSILRDGLGNVLFTDR